MPDHPAAIAYVNQHAIEGDLIFATVPHVVEHYSGRPTDYWLQTTLHLQAILDDESNVLRHRTIGTEMISNRESLERIFARHRRIWLIAVPQPHDNTNDPVVSAYLRANMKVVFEASNCIVLFRGDDTRLPDLHQKDEAALRRAQVNFLP